MVRFSVWCRVAVTLAIAAFAPSIANAADPFELVEPILERKCVNCHNAGEHKGGLNLETAEDCAERWR